MKQLALSDCTEPHFKRVLDHERPLEDVETIYAVFSESVEDGCFCGLALPADIAKHSDWIFADIVEHRPIHAIALDAHVEQALSLMDMHGLSALPVLDHDGKFHNVVTRISILFKLLNQEKLLLQEAQRLGLQVEKDKKRLAAWSEKLSKLHAASRMLLEVLAHTSLEADLLQHGIEALTQLLQAKYGAIGILDETGGLRHFHHVGMSPKAISKIGRFPEGKGLLGVVIKEDHSIRLNDLREDSRSAGFPEGHPIMKSLLAVPISHAGHVYGRIYLCDKLDGQPFTNDDELLAMSFSHSMSLVLENARERAEMEQTQQRLDYLAHFDTLTGLANRELLTDRVQQVIAHSKRHGRKFALMFIDIDNFKAINDTYGHIIGDVLLKQAAGIISMTIREGDTVARLGGDEFVVVLPEINMANDAASVAEKILSAMKEPIKIEEVERELFVTASIGIGIYPDDSLDMETLMSKADTAMYHAKSAGRNTYRFFTPAMNKKLQLHLKLEQHLRQALSHKELMLHYQPQIDLANNKIHGVEALIRWRSQELGNVSPADFIPIAEETGMIIQIGAWVLRTACLQAAEWHRAGFALHMSVNVSAQQLQHDQHFLTLIRSVLGETGLPPDHLVLEITESMLLQGIETTIEVLGTIKEMGIRISMDDFGTGYSSLSYLKRLPLDVVKIDQSFVRDIVTDPSDAAIVAAITAMSKQLNLEVIAEGVETKEQLEFIQAHGCDTVQGYYFSKPIPADEMGTLLQRGVTFGDD